MSWNLIQRFRLAEVARDHQHEVEKEDDSETKSLKPEHANAVSVVSPLEEVCLKLQPLTMAVVVCR